MLCSALISLILLLAGLSIAEAQAQSTTTNAPTNTTTAPSTPPAGQNEAGKAAATSVDPAQALRATRGFMLVAGVVLLLGFLMVIDRYFPILRDRPPPPANPPAANPPVVKPPYSLGRVQMAFWTSIVAVSAVVLYFFGTPSVGAIVLINGTAAILLGISGSAGVVSDFIDSTKDSQAVANNTSGRTAKSDDFFTDILQDDNGNSLHRIQMVIFTLILGVVFCWEVAKGAMPEFSEATLGLMGISKGTYVGFKLPGK